MEKLVILVRCVQIGLVVAGVAVVAFITWAVEHLRFVVIP